MLLLVGRRRTETIQTSLMSFMIPVRKVETSHGQSSVNEAFQLLDLPARWTQRANDFGLTRAHVRFGEDRF